MNKIILSEQNIECGRFCEPIETILQVWKGLTAEYKQKRCTDHRTFIDSLCIYNSKAFFKAKLNLLYCRIGCHYSFSLAIIARTRLSAGIATVATSVRIISFNLHTTRNTHVRQRIFEDFPRIE